ncbi:MAG: dual specificity protein phosphatase family protein [Candidatus Omnitrophota bacterium]
MSDISQITENLFVASKMSHADADAMNERGVVLVISMIRGARPPGVFNEEPFKLLWLRTTDSFLTPISFKKLAAGVEAARLAFEQGGKVLVFCRQGKRRSVTMAAAILITRGYSAQEAMSLLAEKRDVADPQRWYVQWRIRKFERYWRRRKRA